MRFIEALKDGDRLTEVYLCKTRSTAMTKTGKEYENVILQDKTGSLDAKIWDPTSAGIGDYEALDYVEVTGVVTSYNGMLQLKIERLRKVSEGEYEPSNYLPCSRYSIEEMFTELMGYVNSVENTFIKALLQKFFVEDEAFVKLFKSRSAAKSMHHGFMGGLLEHSLSVTRLCDNLAAQYSMINRDLLIACAMLHDVGKVREFSDFPQNDYTDDGNLLGHIVMGSEMISEKARLVPDFPKNLESEMKHCILSHHGELEYGSPKKPSMVEAMVLSMADNLDAKMEMMLEIFEAKDDTVEWLGYNRLFESNLKRTRM